MEKDLQQAFAWLMKAAERGDPDAQTDVGFMYRSGQGVAQDFQRALQWLTKAADQRNQEAEAGLGDMYSFGLGVTPDAKQAFEWYMKAASRGLAAACYNVGHMLATGKGVRENFHQALRWLRTAAEKDFPPAQNQIGVMYEQGQGVEQDYTEAVKWYRMAAEVGEPWGQRNLACMYLYGTGITPDVKEALRWMTKAAEQGLQEAIADKTHIEQVEKDLLRLNISDGSKHGRVARMLLSVPRQEAESKDMWGWIKKGERPSKKDANKFFLACIIDYRMQAELVWKNVREFAEKKLGDPEDLWGFITGFSESDWESKKELYGLHWLKDAHMRAWHIGRDVVARYRGDARAIWEGQSPNEVYKRLQQLGKHGAGDNISNMVIGALLDAGQITGTGDVKADTHVRRVLGRVFRGREFSANQSQEAVQLAREIYPENPWHLDQPLYFLGGGLCDGSAPQCGICYLREECAFRPTRTF